MQFIIHVKRIIFYDIQGFGIYCLHIGIRIIHECMERKKMQDLV